MANRFILNETSYFGCGARKELKHEIIRRNFRKAFIVTDKFLYTSGMLADLQHSLDSMGIAYKVFADVDDKEEHDDEVEHNER